MDGFTLKDMITFATASVGAVLGILNTWRSWDKDRPKLRVVPKQAFLVTMDGQVDDRARLCIQVTNLSAFPLTITEVGVLYRGTKMRGALHESVGPRPFRFPQTLEPRTSLTLYAAPHALRGSRPIRCAYAHTDCGLQFKGNSGALRQLAGEL